MFLSFLALYLVCLSRFSHNCRRRAPTGRLASGYRALVAAWAMAPSKKLARSFSACSTTLKEEAGEFIRARTPKAAHHIIGRKHIDEAAELLERDGDFSVQYFPERDDYYVDGGGMQSSTPIRTDASLNISGGSATRRSHE